MSSSKGKELNRRLNREISNLIPPDQTTKVGSVALIGLSQLLIFTRMGYRIRITMVKENILIF